MWRSSRPSTRSAPPSTTGKRSREPGADGRVVFGDRPGPVEVGLVELRGPLLAAALAAADRAGVELAGDELAVRVRAVGRWPGRVCVRDLVGGIVRPDRRTASACGSRIGASSGPSWLGQTTSSSGSDRPQVAQRVVNGSPTATFRLVWPCGDAPIAWNAASRWRRSGGRRTSSARSRVSGVDSRLTARRWRSTAARPTQPPRPARSRTTSPGFVMALDPGRDEARRRRRRQPIEERQGEARLRSKEARPAIASLPAQSVRRPRMPRASDRADTPRRVVALGRPARRAETERAARMP